jgi:hypothetical protein
MPKPIRWSTTTDWTSPPDTDHPAPATLAEALGRLDGHGPVANANATTRRITVRMGVDAPTAEIAATHAARAVADAFGLPDPRGVRSTAEPYPTEETIRRHLDAL